MDWKLFLQILDAVGLAVTVALVIRIDRRGESPVLALLLKTLTALALLGFATDSWFQNNMDSATSMVVVVLIGSLVTNNYQRAERTRRPGDDSDDAFR